MGKSSPHYELYVAGLAEGSAALTNFVMTILLAICMFTTWGLVVLLWFLVAS